MSAQPHRLKPLAPGVLVGGGPRRRRRWPPLWQRLGLALLLVLGAIGLGLLMGSLLAEAVPARACSGQAGAAQEGGQSTAPE